MHERVRKHVYQEKTKKRVPRFLILEVLDHVVGSVFIDSVKLKTGAPFHRIAYDNCCADWDGLRDHLRDVPWEDTFKLSASAAACEFCK